MIKIANKILEFVNKYVIILTIFPFLFILATVSIWKPAGYIGLGFYGILFIVLFICELIVERNN